jgi:transposase InsO family protein
MGFRGQGRPAARRIADEICSLPQARAVLKASRIDYNIERPHSALDYLTPRPSLGKAPSVFDAAC